MKVVADKLKEIALAADTDHQVDQFGRSAFNRYYYAAYLEVRKNLMEINSAWARAAHTNLPNVLTININKSAKRRAINLNKKGLLTKADMSRILQSIRIYCDELSTILQSGYEARKYADYFPEEIVTRKSDNLSLHNYTIRAAQSWPIRAERRAGQLLYSWRQLG